MILVVLAALCVVAVPLCGRSLARLADVRLRGLWIPLLALALQVLITELAPGGSPVWHRGLQIASYGLLGIFLWANRRLPGVAVIGLGTTLNATAIVANSGVMPASLRAQHVAGLRVGPGFANSAHLAHARLTWLGDVIPWPGPLHNVLSVGDLIIFLGTAYMLQRLCAGPAGVAHPAPAPPMRSPGAEITPGD